jgi:hypothetical protein
MLPSLILASWKANHIFAVIEINIVVRFLPAVKPQGGLKRKLFTMQGGEKGTRILALQIIASSGIPV